MNWFTKDSFIGKTTEEKKHAVEKWGGCEHVEANSDLLVTVSYENDSFGKEGYCVCEGCLNKQTTELNNAEYTCGDCSKPFKLKDGILWRWYDFYSAQGDEPRPVCNSCVNLAKHIHRVKRDRDDYNAEMDRLDNC